MSSPKSGEVYLIGQHPYAVPFEVVKVEKVNDMKKHPGFKAVASSIQKEGYSKKAAGAILANATRKASPSAKSKNPKLRKVK